MQSNADLENVNVNVNVNNEDVDTEMDGEEGEDGNDEPPVHSMDLVNMVENDMSWIGSMQVNNEPLNYDFPVEDNISEDSDEVEMEVPLDDDLCNAQIMARSIIANLGFNNEMFSTISI